MLLRKALALVGTEQNGKRERHITVWTQTSSIDVLWLRGRTRLPLPATCLFSRTLATGNSIGSKRSLHLESPLESEMGCPSSHFDAKGYSRSHELWLAFPIPDH